MRRGMIALLLGSGFVFFLGVMSPSFHSQGFAQSTDKKTERVWKAKCSSCHGVDGKGDTEQGKKMGARDMSNAGWQSEFTDAKIKEAINNGINREKDGKKQEMESFKDKLTAEQIDALVTYIRALKK